jgi:hypothetical protein
MEPPTPAHNDLPPPRRVATEPTPFPPPRRSLSVSSTSSRAGSLSGLRQPDESIETLFSHPMTKIIAFTSSQRPSFAGSGSLAEPKPGSLPASSQLERTIAVGMLSPTPPPNIASTRHVVNFSNNANSGPFRIYRAPGSVAFLSCGSALQPILPKSQCWCIDEASSRFVLQIRRPQYWRIELPVSDPEDAHRALILRDVLDNILLFEKTECPFQRSFTVVLPDRPQTPVKKKPWTPVGKNFISSPFQSDVSPPSPAAGIVNGKKRSKSYVTGSEYHEEAQTPVHVNTGSNTSRIDALRPGPEIEAAVTGEVMQPMSPTPASEISNRLETQGDSAEVRQAISQSTLLSSVIVQQDNHTEGHVQSDLPAAVQDSSRSKLAKPLIEESQQLLEDQSSAVIDIETSDTCLSAFDSPHGLESAKPKEFQPRFENAENADNTTDEHPASDSTNEGLTSFKAVGSAEAVNLKKKRISRILAGRSVTMPPRLTLVTSPPAIQNLHPSAEAASSPPHLPDNEVFSPALQQRSPEGSVDSFHSMQSWHSPITPVLLSPPSSSASPPSFPYPHENIRLPYKGPRDISSAECTPITDATLVPSSAGATVHVLDTYSPATLSAADNCEVASLGNSPLAVESTIASAVQGQPRPHHRPRTADLSISRRALSPLPPAANLFSPTARQHPAGALSVVRKLPRAIIQKTVEILLSPPSHLVSLMLRVAARIAAGEWRGLVFGLDEGGESIPVHWDYSDGELSTWEDHDDYTYSIGRLAKSQPTGPSIDQASSGLPNEEEREEEGQDRNWEVD